MAGDGATGWSEIEDAPRNPTVRPTARVILIDPDQRVLLLRVTDPSRPNRPSFWSTPGGGLDDGESFEDAVRRELAEETGIQDVELGQQVWRRQHVWRWGDDWFDSHERYFLAHTRHTQIDLGGMDRDESAAMRGHRWWRLDELQASSQIFAPRRLAELLAPLLAGDLPGEPIDAGE
jgi:ADP-ribose pyrophosphatase YjhB (NUDIX family)